ncbi:hypothetical protein HPP92_024068 [Vanilla planifolia]|uniref:SDE2/SF3A3 SAP domain-containing protein n=1 Tax=Vanilla planifolia TaxID=51239 RepID=A0A835UCL2_VANPL|nr:hypothetical protein HPP92_024068 [Vanilla planifolia]
MEEVEESVRNSFGVYRDLKRKMCPVSDRSSKKLKIWLGKAKMDDSCSEDDDEFEEKSVVLDDGTSLEKNNVIEGSSSMSAGSGSSSGLESPCGDSEKSNLEQVNQSMLDDGSSDVSTLKNFVKLDERSEQTIKQSCQIEEQNSVLSEVESMIPETAFGSACIPKAVVPEEDMEKQEFFCSSEPIVDNEAYVQSTTNSSFEEPLNFDHYKSAEELMVLGMERLKLELQARGLKCGGTLLERSLRLFLLKTTPLEKLPKKLLRKPSN